MFLSRSRVELATSVLDLPELSPNWPRGQLGALFSIMVFKCKAGDIINSHECDAAYTVNSPPSLQSFSLTLYQMNILFPVLLKFAVKGVDHNYSHISIHIQYVFMFIFIFQRYTPVGLISLDGQPVSCFLTSKEIQSFSRTSKYTFNVLYCFPLVGAPHSKRSHGTPIFL